MKKNKNKIMHVKTEEMKERREKDEELIRKQEQEDKESRTRF